MFLYFRICIDISELVFIFSVFFSFMNVKLYIGMNCYKIDFKENMMINIMLSEFLMVSCSDVIYNFSN